MRKADAIRALVSYRKFMRICPCWIPYDVTRWRDDKLKPSISVRMMRELCKEGFVEIDHARGHATLTTRGEEMERASTGLPWKRRANESPIQYYLRTGKVDDNFTRVWHGWYYCNPAHCRHRWRDKKERDDHLDCAYAALA